MVNLAISGNGNAFTKLWDNNIVSLRLYLKSLKMNLDDFFIEDICSRSFEKAFRQISTYDATRSKFFTWLCKIALNTALDTLESEGKPGRKYVRLDSTSIPSDVAGLSDGEDTPLETIIKDEDREETEGSIEALPELYRQIARMRLVDGMSYKDIADELEIELNTVRTRIRRAKQIIEKMKND